MGEVGLKHLTKRFGDVVAVDDVSLRIEDGEFLVLLGPSGCGKSTILRLVAGLEDASSGEITIAGNLVNFVDPVRRNVAMVFQNYALYPHMTVFDNIAFPLRMARKSRTEIEPAVAEAAAALELDGLLARFPEELSGGQRQRVALARAIVRHPAAFLMDEPLSNLDAQLRVQTRVELMRLHQRLKTTTVYVTHDQVEAMTMGHRIAVMRDGVIQQLGRPGDVYGVPANVFVATFIGAPPMNLLAGAVERSNGGWRFRGGAFDLPLESDELGIHPDALAGVASPVHLGLRPEHLRLGPSGEQGIPGRIQLLEPVGSDLYLTVEVGDTALQVRTPPETPAAVDDNVTLAFDQGRAHVFDADGVNLRLVGNGRPVPPPPAVEGE